MHTFDRVTVCLERREVFLSGQRQSLSTRAFDILELLINARGRLVTKDEIMRVVWPRTFVVDNNIHVHVCELRKLFGGRHGWIRTESGRGYRLSPVEHRLQQSPAPSEPMRPSPLIGRELELAELDTLVDSEVLLTLVGAPGVGKSSLARELARERASTGDEQTLFIELADAAPGTAVVGALGAALALPLPHDLPAIVAAVEHRPALIVLDGCDPVIAEVASLCQSLLTFGARVRLVATSREPLHISAERTWRVPSLNTPDAAAPAEEVINAPAVRLFLRRFGELMADAPLQMHGPKILDAVASLCRRAGGNPLALELAAARATTLGVFGVLQLSDEQWLALGNAMRGVPPRHHSLAAAYAWSYARLSPHVQNVLSRLAALPGSFTIDTACMIAAHCAIDKEMMLAALASLVSKSLIDIEVTPYIEVRRYRVPHALRAFMNSILSASTFQSESVAADEIVALYPYDERPGSTSHPVVPIAAPMSGRTKTAHQATVPAVLRRVWALLRRSTFWSNPDPWGEFPLNASGSLATAVFATPPLRAVPTT